MFYRVQSVEPKDDFILSVLFTDGVKTEYDIKPLFAKWDVFNNLKTIKGLFQQVKVDAGGYGISWNDEIDLPSDTILEYGKAWDPDYTKLTDAERATLADAEAEKEAGEMISHDAIDWNA